MSPPIRDGSGSSIGSIRLGDGTEISEVRTGAGDVLFTASPIPDSADLHAHYDFSREDGSTPVEDQTGNGFDLSGSFSGVTESINGVQAGDFNTDNLTVSFSNQSQPNHVFIVTQPDVVVDNQSPFDADTGSGQLIFQTANNNWSIFAGTTVEDGPLTTDPVIISALFNGSNSEIRVNGTASNGSVGSGTLDGVSLGARGSGSNNYSGAIGEVLVYPQDKSAIVPEVENFLSNKWGITI